VRTAAPAAARRATSTPIKLAIDEPVVRMPLAVAGKPKTSHHHAITRRSTATAA
jgi:hypothetical protein